MALPGTELHQKAYSNWVKFCKNLWLICVFVLVRNLVIMVNIPQVSYVTEMYPHNIYRGEAGKV